MRLFRLSLVSLLLCASCGDTAETEDPEEEEEDPSGCVRPTGYPAERGYIGPVGSHGCATDETCIIPPELDQGKCYRDEAGIPCTVLGEAAPEALAAWSQHCDEADAAAATCAVPAGEWMGTCGALADEQAADGVLPDACDAPAPEAEESFPFTVAVGEVLRFDIDFSANDDLAGVNAYGVVLAEPDGTPLQTGGNDLGTGLLAIYDEPAAATVLHGFGLGGERSWNVVRSGGCAEVPFTSTITRLAPPIANLSLATSTPLAKGVTVRGHLGCSESLGETTGSFDTVFAIEVADGETLNLSFAASAFTSGVGPGQLPFVALLDASGTPVQESGNDVTVGLEPEGAPGRRDVEVPAGAYYLRVSQDFFGCSLMRYALSY